MVHLSAVAVLVLLSTLACADRYNDFDISNLSVPIDYIEPGGPPRDGIPAIHSPNYIRANKAKFLNGSDPVIGIKIGNTAVAYPLHILNWHELVNTVIEHQPILVSYCPLCGTGMVFSAKVGVKELDFGVSGLLYNSDVLFYDTQTESLWSQILKRSIAGSLQGKELESIPSEHTTWAAWKKTTPWYKGLKRGPGL